MSITTGKVRASFVNIFAPRIPEGGGDPKYSVTLIIPKTDTATINSIYAAIEQAKLDGAQKVFGGAVPPGCKIPIYDGDGLRPSGEMFGEECRGCMVLTAGSTQQPSIVDVNLQNIINPSELYSGCYIRANINFFAYNKAGNKGIGCGLNAVQKIEDGEPLVAKVTPQEAFGGANAYAGAVPQAPMQQYQPGAGAGPMQAPMPQYQAPVQQYQAPVPQAPMQQYQAPVPQTPVPQYQAAAPVQQMDPITGRPVVPGGIMGI